MTTLGKTIIVILLLSYILCVAFGYKWGYRERDKAIEDVLIRRWISKYNIEKEVCDG